MLQVLLTRSFPLLVNDDQRTQFVVGAVPIGKEPLRDFGRKCGGRKRGHACYIRAARPSSKTTVFESSNGACAYSIEVTLSP